MVAGDPKSDPSQIMKTCIQCNGCRRSQKWSQWKLAKSVLVYKSVCEMRSLWKSLNRWETKQFGNLEHFSPIHQLVESGSIRGGAFVFITYQHHRHCTKFIHLIKSWIMNHLLLLMNFEASRMDPLLNSHIEISTLAKLLSTFLMKNPESKCFYKSPPVKCRLHQTLFKSKCGCPSLHPISAVYPLWLVCPSSSSPLVTSDWIDNSLLVEKYRI